MSDFDWLKPMQRIGKETFRLKSADIRLFRELLEDGTVRLSDGTGLYVLCLNTDLDIYDGASRLIGKMIGVEM